MPESLLFSTRKMLESLKIHRPPATFFATQFFGPTEQSLSNIVEIDIEKDGRQMAAFVHPRSEAKTVEEEVYEKRLYKVPYTSEKRIIDAEDILKTMPGMIPHASDEQIVQSLADRQAKALDVLINRIVRRVEWMCREALWYGQVRCTGEGVDEVVDFRRSPDHTITLSGADQWGQDGVDIVGDLEEWVEVLGDAGYGATDVILGKNAAAAFRNDEKVQKLLKANSGIRTGELDLTNLPSKVRHLGHILGMDFWAYVERYTDPETNQVRPLVPENEVLVVDREARRARHYGAILDFKAIRAEGLAVGEYAVPYFPKVVEIEEPSSYQVIVKSAPLPIPHAVDASVRAVVMS